MRWAACALLIAAVTAGCASGSTSRPAFSVPAWTPPSPAPTRTAAEHLPATVLAVLHGTDLGQRTYDVTLSLAQSQVLAAAFNALPAATPQPPHGCAMPRSVDATFTAGADVWEFDPDCDGLGVTFDHQPQAELDNPWSGDWALMSARDAYFNFFASAATDGQPESPPPHFDDPAPDVTLTDADNGRSVTVPVGTVLAVDLAVTPPTSVATWPGSGILQTIGSSSGLAPTSHLLLRAIATGSTDVIAPTFPVCAKPPGCGAAPVFVFHINVTPKH